jgi:hypothetical protein
VARQRERVRADSHAPAAVLTACACRRAAWLCVCPLRAQLEIGASIYKEGAEQSDGGGKDDVLCLRIKSVNALVNL